MKPERREERERVHLKTLAKNHQKPFKRSHAEKAKQRRIARTARCMCCGSIVTACTCKDHLKPHYMTQISNFGGT